MIPAHHRPPRHREPGVPLEAHRQASVVVRQVAFRALRPVCRRPSGRGPEIPRVPRYVPERSLPMGWLSNAVPALEVIYGLAEPLSGGFCRQTPWHRHNAAAGWSDSLHRNYTRLRHFRCARIDERSAQKRWKTQDLGSSYTAALHANRKPSALCYGGNRYHFRELRDGEQAPPLCYAALPGVAAIESTQ
jgi:hypothetical protein